ncbi:MAG: hypothetical protein OES24_18720 [Acidimicrobiia bacterium]|nr:hypothetical protein [Acidimicrobiia bacterium]
MIRRLLTLLPLAAAAMLAVSAVPAQGAQPAQKPINGRMDITLNLIPCDDGRFLSWTGTVVIDGVTYGWSDEPLLVPDPPQQPNDKFVYGEENWTIFTLEPGQDPNENPQLACGTFDADRVVLAGFNSGWGAPGGTGKADGVVNYVGPGDDNPFANVAEGSRMFWRGELVDYPPNVPDLLPPGTEFTATLHITD